MVAVISLPGGVFQPYSGVKTSILILDKVLAQKADSVAFFRVENDGYDLGAQRRPINKDDLPVVAGEVNEYLSRLRAGESLDSCELQTGLLAAKDHITSNVEYNLSGDRYQVGSSRTHYFPVVSLGDVAGIIAGQSPPGELVQ